MIWGYINWKLPMKCIILELFYYSYETVHWRQISKSTEDPELISRGIKNQREEHMVGHWQQKQFESCLATRYLLNKALDLFRLHSSSLPTPPASNLAYHMLLGSLYWKRYIKKEKIYIEPMASGLEQNWSVTYWIAFLLKWIRWWKCFVLMSFPFLLEK